MTVMDKEAARNKVQIFLSRIMLRSKSWERRWMRRRKNGINQSSNWELFSLRRPGLGFNVYHSFWCIKDSVRFVIKTSTILRKRLLSHFFILWTAVKDILILSVFLMINGPFLFILSLSNTNTIVVTNYCEKRSIWLATPWGFELTTFHNHCTRQLLQINCFKYLKCLFHFWKGF